MYGTVGLLIVSAAAAVKPILMGIRVEPIGVDGVRDALKKLRRLLWLHDCEPVGRRLKWHKKRHDRFVKPSQLRHRRDLSTWRKKHDKSCHYVTLDGLEGWVVEEDLHR
jgi:hypothetical protein